MISLQLLDAVSTLAAALVSHPEYEEELRERWRFGEQVATELPAHVLDAADRLTTDLPAVTQLDELDTALEALYAQGGSDVLLAWCASSAWRRDVRMAALLKQAANQAEFRQWVAGVASARVLEGPLHDALACAPLVGDGADFEIDDNAEARARMEILIWEAGASALEVPDLGRWIWDSAATFKALIERPSKGALRGRVLAARCLEVSVGGMPPTTDQELVGWTLEVLQPLLLHPEPAVWVHAARALGRLTGNLEQLEGMLLDWVLGSSTVLRQRAITAFASLPAARFGFLASQLVQIVDDPGEDPWVLAAVAAATPYLFFERRDIWDKLAARVLA
ncbi:MAG: hypothetical protein JRI23_20145, partial [Deltaproteobacteria bacterium]|nr:hypothetical protein [Deltaproteobacteria bacterium]MBW2534187.1 hypothetical protein [Deltaproteobacteria bacterium]